MHQSVFRRRASQTIPLLISVKMCSFLVALLIVMHWGFPLVSSNLNDTCVTDSGRSGRCVLVRDCQYALDILHDNYLTYEEYRYIDNNMCGKVPGKPPLPLVFTISEQSPRCAAHYTLLFFRRYVVHQFKMWQAVVFQLFHAYLEATKLVLAFILGLESFNT